jgi:two-component system cell cycle response regulator
MKILVVEDETTIRLAIRMLLEEAGHDVIEAGDGATAWNLIQQHTPRVIIADWMMPELDGLSLIQRIRASSFLGYTYVIMLTARDTKDDLLTGLDAGADDYLAKPFDFDELCARIAIGVRIMEHEDRLRAQATFDTLTGLLNRRAITDFAEAELSRTLREDARLSVIMLDVDHFKSINDTYGHDVGDQALQLVADTMTICLRSCDRVGRWGGEEFLVVLPGAAQDEAAAVGERIRHALATTPLPLADGSELSLTASLGVATTIPCTHTDLPPLVQAADEALYTAKRTGRNRVCLAHPTPFPHTPPLELLKASRACSA